MECIGPSTFPFYVFFSICIRNLIENSQANDRDTGRTLRSVASDLGLHCLHMSYKKDARTSVLFPSNTSSFD